MVRHGWWSAAGSVISCRFAGGVLERLCCVMSDVDRTQRRRARHGPIRASLVSVTCLLRGMPLFFCAAPRTPLRVLCIIALDTLHVLRHSEPLPRKRINELATFLDFQACTNAAWDRKDLCEAQYRSIRQRLEKAGLGVWIEEYLGRLRKTGKTAPVTQRGSTAF